MALGEAPLEPILRKCFKLNVRKRVIRELKVVTVFVNWEESGEE